jgi:AcrR family transcriptional regulator
MSEVDTSTRILNAAQELFGDVGYDGVSMRDIADRADVNKALVFYHHNNKNDLFRRVLNRFFEAQRRAMQEALEEDPDSSVRTKLHNIGDAYIDFIYEHPRYPKLIQNTLTSGGEHIDVLREHLGGLLRTTEGILADLCPEEGPRAARHVMVTLTGAASNYFTYAPVIEGSWDGEGMVSEESLEERREHLHWIVDLIVDGLKE